MAIKKVFSNALSMIFFIIISGIIGIVGFAIIIASVYLGLAYRFQFIGVIGIIIGTILIGVAGIVYKYYTSKYDIDFQPGHRMRTKHLNY
jgi:hypothetical protein